MPVDPPPTDRQQHVARLVSEYYRRVAAGEPLEVAAYLQEHPEYESDLRKEFNKHEGTVVHSSTAEDALRSTSGNQRETLTHHFTPNGEAGSADLAQGDFSVSDVANELEQSERPRRFGEYDLLAIIGRGGMGIVCKARQRSINRTVALKMIRDGQFASGADIERFYIEARAAGSLTHPNIVTVHEAGVEGGHHFYSMEFIEGEDLGHRIRREPLASEEIAPLMITISKAVHYAHTKGILHRDLKPANVLIDQQGHPLVTDFGLARQVGKQSNLTASGTPMGTPGYMPPEQAAGRVDEFGPTVDVYSLGAVLYEMLTGEPPFTAESLAEIVMKVLHKQPAAPHTINPAVNRDLETICLKCLEKDPKKRYPSALELAQDLERAHLGKPILARPASLPRKAWHWLRDVPLVAALVGRRVVHPTPLHKAAQWCMLGAIGLLLAATLAWQFYTPGMPRQVRVLAGHREGKYHAVATDLAKRLAEATGRPATVLETAGSVENHHRLLEGEGELALIQAESLVSNQLAVAAPLYYEYVLIIVRHETMQQKQIDDVSDLARCHIALGPPGSGMRQGAMHLLRSLNIDPAQLPENDSQYLELLSDETLEAAIVIAGLENPGVRRVLETGEFALLPIESAERLAMRSPSFHAGHLFADQVPPSVGSQWEPEGLATLLTPAYLVVRRDAPDALVHATLSTLYNSPALLENHSLIPRDDAARWRAIPRHPAAEAFFAKQDQALGTVSSRQLSSR